MQTKIVNEKNSDLNKGHRQRVKEKFLTTRKSFQDYELLEMLLFLAFPRKDTKNLAKILMNKFKTLNNLVNADVDQLRGIEGVGEGAIIILKLFQEIHLRILKNNIMGGNDNLILDSVETVAKYCQSYIGSLVHEEILVLFINNSGQLVVEDIINTGGTGEVKIYKNLLITKATQNGANNIIIAHNHPSGDEKPSNEDIRITKDLFEILIKVDIKLIDHIIVSKNGFFSFAKQNMIQKFQSCKFSDIYTSDVTNLGRVMDNKFNYKV